MVRPVPFLLIVQTPVPSMSDLWWIVTQFLGPSTVEQGKGGWDEGTDNRPT